MSSSTPTPVAANINVASTLTDLFGKLTIDELTQVQAAATPAISGLATGDGSVLALDGALLQLQGAFVANASVFQKIGVNDLAAAFLNEMNIAVEAVKVKIAAAELAATNTSAS